MLDFRRITLFCSDKCLLKHKMTMFSKNWGVAMAPSPLDTPMLTAVLVIWVYRSVHPRVHQNFPGV